MLRSTHRAMDEDAFKDALRQLGLKCTPQRTAVYMALKDMGHGSVEMVREKILESNPTMKISTASVYNVLHELSEKRLISRRLSAGSRMFFDITPLSHVHLYNPESDSYRDIEDRMLEDFVQEWARSRRFRGYRLDHVDINIVVSPKSKR